MPPRSLLGPTISPVDFHFYTGLEVPDPITFAISPQWLDRPQLYPRQATLLKVIFLREDLFTEFDYMVVQEWEDNFRRTGNNGITPGVLRRMRFLRENGHPYFREVLLVLGRRAGKGYVSALAMAYVMWRYMSKGDPQGFYGVDRDKQLACFIYAGKKDQARDNLWRDLVNVIQGGPCYAPYINRPLGESLSVYAPHDFVRMKKLARRGIHTERDMATFTIQPKEATLMSGRGPASFMQAYDEMAHVIATGANRSAEDVYCLDPATRVLKADLSWSRIDDLVPGDTLVSLDEEPPGVSGTPRKLREATVRHKWDTEGVAYRITLEDGSSVVCSGNHRWLRSRSLKGGNTKWATIMKPPVLRDGAGGNWAQLRVGDHIQHLVDPWEEVNSYEAGYLSGVYDGEGHVRFDPRGSMKIGFAQNPGPVRDYVLSLLKDADFEVRHQTREGTCQSFEIVGLRDCFRFLGSYRPLRLSRNARDMWQGRAVRGDRSFKRVVSIEELPSQRLVDIETSTGTFIAEGLVSHNSAATPALDQFKKDAFIIEPSSPWQQIGQFYTNWENALAVDESGMPEYPAMLMLQLTSWDIYEDWEMAHQIPLFPDEFPGDLGEYADKQHPTLIPLKGAIQELDENLLKLEKANPDTFAVERRSHWQATMDAYLDPKKIAAMFDEDLVMRTEGALSIFYKGHADPSLANANFGVAIAHPEKDEEGNLLCVFDYIHHWRPSDFPDNIIDYPEIDDHLWRLIEGFKPDEFTFDQWNSANSIARLQREVRKARFPKRVDIHEKTATLKHNWERAENFKIALNQGWIRAPYYEQAELELKFLQLKNGKVEKQDAGPVQTKDVADCLMEVVWTILGEQVRAWTHGALSDAPLTPFVQGGFNPYSRETSGQDQATFERMSGLGSARTAVARGGGRNPARNPLANRRRQSGW